MAIMGTTSNTACRSAGVRIVAGRCVAQESGTAGPGDRQSTPDPPSKLCAPAGRRAWQATHAPSRAAKAQHTLYAPARRDALERRRITRPRRYLVDPASNHMLVSKIKPCMSKYKPL